jgi:uroporphyrinogen-III synthase
MAFDSRSILALESRRAAEMEKLITNQGGKAFVAPSMREVPIESNTEAFAFAERLFAGEFDLVILLTGVGTRYLDKVISTRYEPGRFAEALRKLPVFVRGPKPLAVCREMSVPVAGIAAEPNTWRELLAAMEGRSEKHIAVQEYGKTNAELIAALEERGGEVTRVPVYQWEMPEDTGPLREAVRRLSAKEFDAVLFTTSVQADHLMTIAEQEQMVGPIREGLDHAVIASIGPTTTEALNGHGLRPDFEPTHPKMGIMVFELARDFHELSDKKSRSRL